MRSAREIWEAALGELELQVNKPNFNTWLAKTTGLSRRENRITIGTPNTFVAEYLDTNQRSLIEKTLINVTGTSMEVVFEVVSARQPASAAAKSHPPRRGRSAFNPRYTFDSFIVGGSNRMAHAAALSSTKGSGGGYNPLFIHGGVGLGKTHLLMATGRLAQTNGLKVLYVSGEQFTNDFIRSVREKQTEEFRTKYRSLDLLLVDDIQFIGGKQQTEECFFHTFNELHQRNSQIVLSGDCPPRGLPLLEDRLRSRFEWGLSVEIQPPELKTRLAILRARAEEVKADIPAAVLAIIARKAKRSIRELEGSLNRVVAYARILQTSITAALAHRALTDIGGPAGQNEPTPMGQVVDAVAHSFKITAADIIGRRRDKETALARQVAMYLVKQRNSCSLSDIGREIGGRSPATVSHAYEKISRDIENSALLRRKISEIKKGLSADSHAASPK
jgi:chromosomal replication initiator protein